MKSISLNRVNEILNKELFDSDDITLKEVVDIILSEWDNISMSQQKDICSAIAGKRKGKDIITRGYLDYINKIK